MKHRALIVAHADPDGHVIAEQTRRNLSSIRNFSIDTFIDPILTKGHRSWLNVHEISVKSYDYVFFVDLMFAPLSFREEANALVRFVGTHPDIKFVVMDHHPLPLRLLKSDNLRVSYRSDVYDCTVGPASDLMITAALCEAQPTRAADWKERVDPALIIGMKRAAAGNSPLVGQRLSTLLENDRWEDIAALGREPKIQHPRPRGRIPKGTQLSDAFTHLISTADHLASVNAAEIENQNEANKRGAQMAFDTDLLIHPDRPPFVMSSAVRRDPHDLQTIMTLLELAALQLSPNQDSTFTAEDLVEMAQEIAGPEIVLDVGDVRNVMGKAGILKSAGGGRLKLR